MSSPCEKVAPLANYYHCGAHVTHLAASKSISESKLISDALEQVQELGNIYSQSGKFKTLYLHSNDLEDSNSSSHGSIKPICPTHFLTRAPAVKSVVDNYGSIISALLEAGATFGTTTAARANGLHRYLSTGKCILGLLAALPIIGVLESLNKVLQGRSTSVSGMIEVVQVAIDNLKGLRNEDTFHDIYQNAEEFIEKHNLDDIVLGRYRKIPKKIDNGSASVLFESA